MDQSLDHLCVTTLRMLAADAVEQANSGHPGMPLGAAPMAYVLWYRILRHNPANPDWPDRDRFILSPGHGAALLYGLLHLSGYDLPLEELRNFRQWGSRCPGHPEKGLTPGVEATTGPLGQGFAMGVGMALAERQLAQSYNRQEFLPVMDHFTYAIVSDGDLMEGITSEAASLAGHLCLGKLIYLYDDNHISIEGNTNLTFSEDVAARFEAYQWQVIKVADGEDLDALENAVRQAQGEDERPSLIIVRTHIGFGSPKVDSASCHGSPLGAEAMAATRDYFNWPKETFHIPQAVRDHFQKGVVRGEEQQAEWSARVEALRSRFPEETARFLAQMQGALPPGWDTELVALTFGDHPLATRSASGQSLNAFAHHLPALMGGAADLAPSNNTWLKGLDDQNIHFGVREHAMAAITNGLALHGGIIPFCGTFLVFSDYMRTGIRLAAAMETHTIFVLTHDSIALGEDGPTHQPVEQLVGLRAIPGLLVLRPADAPETAAAWHLAITLKRPTALILSRQKLPVFEPERRKTIAEGVGRGAYVVSDGNGAPELILLATGSEVSLALAAKKGLAEQGRDRVRVVSMPSWELFQEQPAAYRNQVLPPDVKARVSIEAGSTMGWHRWVGDGGAVIGLDRFGASAPGGVVMAELGFSVQNVVAVAQELLKA